MSPPRQFEKVNTCAKYRSTSFQHEEPAVVSVEIPPIYIAENVGNSDCSTRKKEIPMMAVSHVKPHAENHHPRYFTQSQCHMIHT